MAETWQLIEDIRALVAREGWQDDIDALRKLDLRIAQGTGVGIMMVCGDRFKDAPEGTLCFVDPPFFLIERDWDQIEPWGAPFLRSRDAAVMLERALVKMLGERDQNPVLSFEVRATIFPESIDEPNCLATVICDSQWVSRLLADSEPVVRTLAALEAGHKLGIWPKEVAPTHG